MDLYYAMFVNMKKYIFTIIMAFAFCDIYSQINVAITPRNISYHSNGKPAWETEYIGIWGYSGGKRRYKQHYIGWLRKWYDNGQLDYEKYYHNPGCKDNPKWEENPMLNGLTQICQKPFEAKTHRGFYKSGKKKYIKKHKSKYNKNGEYYTQTLSLIFWHENGKKKSEHNYSDDNQEWFEKEWYENGILSSEKTFQKSYKITESGEEIDQKINKKTREWHKNGGLKYEVEYFNYPKLKNDRRPDNYHNQLTKKHVIYYNKNGEIMSQEKYILLIDDTTKQEIKDIYEANRYTEKVKGFGIDNDMLLCRHGDFISKSYWGDSNLNIEIIKYNKGEKISSSLTTVSKYGDPLYKDGKAILYKYDSTYAINIVRIEDSLINLNDIYDDGTIKSTNTYLQGE